MGTHNRKDQLTANDGKVLIGAAAAAATAAVSFPFTGDLGSRGGSEVKHRNRDNKVQCKERDSAERMRTMIIKANIRCTRKKTANYEFPGTESQRHRDFYCPAWPPPVAVPINCRISRKSRDSLPIRKASGALGVTGRLIGAYGAKSAQTQARPGLGDRHDTREKLRLQPNWRLVSFLSCNLRPRRQARPATWKSCGM